MSGHAKAELIQVHLWEPGQGRPVYFRDGNEKFTLANPKPAQYVRTMIAVRRLTPEQFDADPGQAVG